MGVVVQYDLYRYTVITLVKFLGALILIANL